MLIDSVREGQKYYFAVIYFYFILDYLYCQRIIYKKYYTAMFPPKCIICLVNTYYIGLVFKINIMLFYNKTIICRCLLKSLQSIKCSKIYNNVPYVFNYLSLGKDIALNMREIF